MAQITGSAGKNSRILAESRRKMHYITFILTMTGIFLAMGIFLKLNRVFSGIGTAIIILLYMGALRFILVTSNKNHRHLKKRRRDAVRGAKGEDLVAGLLTLLPEEYYVFHDLSKLAGDIDHIVVGPTGVFVIETKAHGGQIVLSNTQLLLNGHETEKDFIAQSWRNAFWVRDVLKNTIEVDVQVKPILVFSNAFVTGNKSLKGVRVINKKFLVNTILHGKTSNLPTEKIVEILRRKIDSK